MASWTAMQQHMSEAMGNPYPSSGEEQTMWMQHMYAQYMAHYMQYVQSAAMGSGYPQAAVGFMQPQPPPHPAPNLGPGVNPAAANLPAPVNNEEPPVIQVLVDIYIQDRRFHTPNHSPPQNQPPPVAAPGAAAAAPAGAPQPQVINAGAGGAMAGLEEDDDENQQRDALDWLYITSRPVSVTAM